MIGLSPLATAHPRLFQQAWVRSSSACYRTFNLAMARSLGFGSHPSNSVALFRLAFATPPPYGLSLLDRRTRCPIIQKVRSHRLAKAEPASSFPCNANIETRGRFPGHVCFDTARFCKGLKRPLTFGEPAPSVCRRPVSGLFHSPRRGAFHLSLTVLVRYRSHTST